MFFALVMPKIYNYLGIIILFYSNEHEPIHVHGKYDEKESKDEIIIEKWINYFVLHKKMTCENIKKKIL